MAKGCAFLDPEKRIQSRILWARASHRTGGPSRGLYRACKALPKLHLGFAAVADLDNAIEGGAPSSVYIARAELHIALERWDLAQRDLGIAKRKDPDNIVVTKALARLLAIADEPVADPRKSLEFAQAAHRLDPSPASLTCLILSFAANDNEARVKQFRNDLLESEEGKALNEQLATDLRFLMRKKFNRGRSLFFNERYDLAVEELEQVVSICPSHDVAWLWLGRCQSKQEDYAAAIRSLTRHSALNPDAASGHHDLATAYFQLNKFEDAIDSMTRCVKLRPSGSKDIAQDLYWRARAYLYRNELEKACDDLTRAVDADATHYGATELLARVLATCRDDDIRDGTRAVELAEEAVKLSGEKEVAALDTLACAFAEAGDVANALAVMQQLFQFEIGPSRSGGINGPQRSCKNDSTLERQSSPRIKPGTSRATIAGLLVRRNEVRNQLLACSLTQPLGRAYLPLELLCYWWRTPPDE